MRAIILSVCCCITYLVGFSQNRSNFNVHGNIKGLKEGTKMSLMDKFVGTVVSTAIVKDEKFILSGHTTLNNVYALTFEQEFRPLLIWIDEDSDLSIKGSVLKPIKENLRSIPLTYPYEVEIRNTNGKGSQNDRNDLAIKIASIYKKSRSQDLNSASSLSSSIHDEVLAFISSHLNSSFTPYLMYEHSEFNWPLSYQEIKTAYERLSAEVKNNSFLGREVGMYINDKETIKILSSANSDIGQTIPDFKLLNVNGDSISIKKVLSKAKAKIALLDLWSEADQDRHDELNRLLNLSKAYGSKGLAIVRISRSWTKNNRQGEIDKIQAVLKEGIPWYELAEVRQGGMGKSGMQTYGSVFFKVADFPYKVLIDENGKILAKGLTLDAAEKKIREILESSAE